MGPPYGVVGPSCKQGNTLIFEHDFTHRLHMEIFDQEYYPPALTDWWLDNWISAVYGVNRTKKLEDVEVHHYMDSTRYSVTHANEELLGGFVEAGRLRITDWMKAHKMPAS